MLSHPYPYQCGHLTASTSNTVFFSFVSRFIILFSIALTTNLFVTSTPIPAPIPAPNSPSTSSSLSLSRNFNSFVRKATLQPSHTTSTTIDLRQEHKRIQKVTKLFRSKRPKQTTSSGRHSLQLNDNSNNKTIRNVTITATAILAIHNNTFDTVVNSNSKSHTTYNVTVNVTQRSSQCPIILPQHVPQLDTTTPPQKIVGGDRSSTDLAPYLARLEQNDAPKCSGVIVSPTLVLTAAHCCANVRSPAHLSVFIGGTNNVNNPGQKFSVASFTVHPRYRFVQHNDKFTLFDIALVYLAEVPDPHLFKPMAINTNRSVPAIGSFVRVAGYGVLDPSIFRRRTEQRTLVSNERKMWKKGSAHRNRRIGNLGRLANSKLNLSELQNVDLHLYQVDVPVVSGSDCMDSYTNSNIQINDTRNICAGYMGIGKCDSWYVSHPPIPSTSFHFPHLPSSPFSSLPIFHKTNSKFSYGDSGGPLFVYNARNEPVLVGLVSSGLGCAEKNFPGVYVRISKYNLFIPRDIGVTRTSSVVTVISHNDGQLLSFGNTSVTASHTPSPSPAQTEADTVTNTVKNRKKTVIIAISAGSAVFLVLLLLVSIFFYVRRRRRRERC